MKNVQKIETEVKGAEWEKILDDTFKKRNKDLKVDGFRKGKCPKNVYLQKFGIESLFMDASDAALQIAYKKVLDENDIVPVVEPAVDIKSVDKDGIKLEFTLITRPEVKLGKYKDLGIKKDKVTVSKEELEKEEARIASRYADMVVKENGEVLEGNTAVIDFKGFVDGKELDGGTGTDYSLEIGSHTFIPGFEDGLIGMKTGESKDLNLKFPEDYTEELKGKDVKFEVTIKEIKERVLPEFNKDFFQDLGYDNLSTKEEFDKEVKKAITDKKTEEVNNKYYDDVISAACDNMEVEINPEIIADEVKRTSDRMAQSLQQQGINLEMYLQFTGKTKEEFEKDLEPEAIKNVKARYLIEEVARAEKIEVTDKEVEEHAAKEAEKYGIDKNEFLSYVGGLDVVKYDLRMKKALSILTGEEMK